MWADGQKTRRQLVPGWAGPNVTTATETRPGGQAYLSAGKVLIKCHSSMKRAQYEPVTKIEKMLSIVEWFLTKYRPCMMLIR
jgi:hypothetical protein